MDESISGEPSHVLKGRFIDLFDARLPILSSVALTPGSCHLRLDLDRVTVQAPAVLASACRTLGAGISTDGSFRFYAEGPDQTTASVRVSLARLKCGQTDARNGKK